MQSFSPKNMHIPLFAKCHLAGGTYNITKRLFALASVVGSYFIREDFCRRLHPLPTNSFHMIDTNQHETKMAPLSDLGWLARLRSLGTNSLVLRPGRSECQALTGGVQNRMAHQNMHVHHHHSITKIHTETRSNWFDVVPAVVMSVRRWKKASTIERKTTISKCTGIVASPLQVRSILFGHYSVLEEIDLQREHIFIYGALIRSCSARLSRKVKKLFIFLEWSRQISPIDATFDVCRGLPLSMIQEAFVKTC